jgi:hypothetical protein
VQTITTIVSRFRLCGSCKLAKYAQFLRSKLVIVKDSLFDGNVNSVPQLAEVPKAKRQSLIRCDPRFAVEHQRVVRPLWFIVLVVTIPLFLVFLFVLLHDGVCSNVDVLSAICAFMFAHGFTSKLCSSKLAHRSIASALARS